MKSGKTGKMLFRNDTQRLLRMKALAIIVWTMLIFSAGHVLAADIPLPPAGALANLTAPSDVTGQQPQPVDTVPTTALPPEATSTTAPAASTTTSKP